MQSSAVDGTGAAAAADRLTVDVRVHGRNVVVSLAGELDNDSIDLLRERLVDALGRPASDRLVVNCRNLSFCDSTGLNTLLTARRNAEEAGSTLVLAGLQPAVARVFEITGADSVFDIRPDLDTALR
ncbi:STAS domain-containing protein [Kitasatospora sp. NBC_01302]|uniref:STAS domain-containing protein n=1 Tax=Kitasatospora sp. NBC_01302 TaxID=2903575 RepID=UPI002E106504|nr:STAS domain-containing protein [Kitasatospora sp. NBC_01302]